LGELGGWEFGVKFGVRSLFLQWLFLEYDKLAKDWNASIVMVDRSEGYTLKEVDGFH